MTCACDFEWLPMALTFSAQGRDGSASKVLREKSMISLIRTRMKGKAWDIEESALV